MMLLDLIAALMRDQPGWNVGSKRFSQNTFKKKRAYTYDNVRNYKI